MIRIRKIRISKEKVKINYDELTSDNKWIKLEIESPEMPFPKFANSVQNLADDIGEILELEPDKVIDISVSGVTFKYKDDTNDYFAYLIGKRPVKLSNSPENLNCPGIYLGKLDETDIAFEFKSNLKVKLADIHHFAERYILGEREKPEQTQLDFNKTSSEA